MEKRPNLEVSRNYSKFQVLVQIEKNGEEPNPWGFKNLLKIPGTSSIRKEWRRNQTFRLQETIQRDPGTIVQIEKNGEETKPWGFKKLLKVPGTRSNPVHGRLRDATKFNWVFCKIYFFSKILVKINVLQNMINLKVPYHANMRRIIKI